MGWTGESASGPACAPAAPFLLQLSTMLRLLVLYEQGRLL